MMAPTNAVPFERIHERAFELSDRHHRPEGLDIRFWLLTERELRAEAVGTKGLSHGVGADRDGGAS